MSKRHDKQRSLKEEADEGEGQTMPPPWNHAGRVECLPRSWWRSSIWKTHCHYFTEMCDHGSRGSGCEEESKSLPAGKVLTTSEDRQAISSSPDWNATASTAREILLGNELCTFFVWHQPSFTWCGVWSRSMIARLLPVRLNKNTSAEEKWKDIYNILWHIE